MGTSNHFKKIKRHIVCFYNICYASIICQALCKAYLILLSNLILKKPHDMLLHSFDKGWERQWGTKDWNNYQDFRLDLLDSKTGTALSATTWTQSKHQKKALHKITHMVGALTYNRRWQKWKFHGNKRRHMFPVDNGNESNSYSLTWSGRYFQS